MKKILVLFLLAILSCRAFAMDFDYIENLSYEDRIADYKFYYGMEEVWRLGESAIVNNMGKIIIDYSSKAKGILSNGLIAIIGDNGKIGFFNQKNHSKIVKYQNNLYYLTVIISQNFEIVNFLINLAILGS
jgi:hypothetical protein